MTFSDGIPFVFSQRVHVVSVSLPPDGTALDSEFSPIGISVANYDDKAHVIDAQNVQVSSDNPRLRIVPETEIRDRINNRAMWARIANAFGAAANIAAASMPSTTTYSGSAYGRRTGYVGYSGTITTYDPARVAVAGAQIQREHAAIDSSIENTRRTLIDEFSNGIRRHTLYPNDSYLGVIYVENRQLRHASSLRLAVTFGGETHTFNVDFGQEGRAMKTYDYSAPESTAATPPRPRPQPAESQPAESAPVFTPTKVSGAIVQNQRITFETRDGRRFYAARIIEVAPDYIIVSTIDGVFTLKKGELPEDMAKALPGSKADTEA